jgi:LuxR family maltose regulon positive regulatory protein
MKWIEALPHKFVLSKPNLCIFYAWELLMVGKFAEVKQYLKFAGRGLGPSSHGKLETSSGEKEPSHDITKVELQGRIAAIHACMASFSGNVLEIIQYSKQALKYLSDESYTWRCLVSMSLGDAHMLSGDGEAASHAYSEAVTASQTVDDVYLFLTSSMLFAITEIQQGRLHHAIEIYQQLLQCVNERDLSKTDLAGWVLAAKGEILCEWNDLNKALKYVKKGVELSKFGHSVYMQGYIYFKLVRVLFAKQDLASAEEVIRKIEKIIIESDMPQGMIYRQAAWKGRLWVAQGNLDAASQWVEERGLNVDDKLTYLREKEHIVLARILIAQGRLDKVNMFLERLIREAESGARIARQIEIFLIQALAYKIQGEIQDAISSLKNAITLAEPGGFIRIFVDEGPLIAELLEKVLDEKNDVPHAYVKKLLSAFRLDKIIRTDYNPINQLSERELDVLRLMEVGFSNTKIANELYISLNTVKTHTKNINSKLDVHNRTEAVKKAKEIELL